MAKNVKIYRKKMCPFGQKAVDLLTQQGYSYQDHLFDDKEEEQTFKAGHQVSTTPQIFIDGERIGGYSELAKHFNVAPETNKNKKSYVPVVALFSVALLLALATETQFKGFMGFSLSLLALQKLMDIKAFVSGFKQYDLLAPHITPYAYAYPFLELASGLGILASFILPAVAIVMLVIGGIGAVSVINSVYIKKKDLNCACVGGNSNVPLGALSLTENLMMLFMGIILIV
ncbi:MauE/DoxX family redox-associated membrane protein [Gayadomonas joobiniege]|uniref:MauE/DoxX family redox-associated membrane protein n=1 Tax=Gayadomonas joobiniege TaxID=1234606 RepID=UPI0003659239|nr:MauE/DoxX family redox-associated membrane protein [Gayadomonas joobiniege]